VLDDDQPSEHFVTPLPPLVVARRGPKLDSYQGYGRALSVGDSAKADYGRHAVSLGEAMSQASAARQVPDKAPTSEIDALFKFNWTIWGGTVTEIVKGGFPTNKYDVSKSKIIEGVKILSTTTGRNQADLITKVFKAAKYTIPTSNLISIDNFRFIASVSSANSTTTVADLALDINEPISITDLKREYCIREKGAKSELPRVHVMHLVYFVEDGEEDDSQAPVKTAAKGKGVKREHATSPALKHENGKVKQEPGMYFPLGIYAKTSIQPHIDLV